MNNRRNLSAIVLLLATAFFAPLSAVAQVGGGTSGADFLISPPSARISAMGGVADPLGSGLEAMSYNPAALAGLDGMRLQLTIDPYPNSVTNSHLAFGMPLGGGYAVAAAQLFNVGGFTLINDAGQPLETVNVFDLAAGVAYGRLVWKSVAVGADLKAVYRALGADNAFAIAGDLGAVAWFQTPYIGQPPRPPSREELAARAAREKAGLDSEKKSRTADATKASAAAKKALEAAEKNVTDLTSQLDKAAEDKKPPIQEKLTGAQATVETRRTAVADAEKSELDALAAIDTWYQDAVAKAQAAADKRLADLDSIASERKALYAVIDDPAQELTAEMVDASINTAIEKTRGLEQQRADAANQRKAAWDTRRAARVEGINKTIASYQSMIAEASASQPATDKPTSDPWVKRLTDRIAAKQAELKQIEAEATAMAAETGKSIADYAAAAGRDVKDFEAQRTLLQKELRKDKLKRELDLVDARSKTATEKVQSDYKAKERELYLRLLSAVYRHEEKTFQNRLAAARDDAAIRQLDFEVDQETARTNLDDTWAFDERMLSAKVKESLEPTDAKKVLADRQTAYVKGSQDLDQKERDFASSEKARLDGETAAIQDQRTHVRLVYLQTDRPYLNTAVGVGLRNVGTPVKFVTEAVPLPMSAVASASYALVNVQDHNLKLTTLFDLPVMDAWSWTLGIGVEYSYAGLAYARLGYTVSQAASGFGAISAGLGVHLTAGFTQYAVDYAFKPLADYGLQHSIGVTISF